MKRSKKVRCRKNIVKTIKTDLPLKVGGYEILGVDNCDLLSFKKRLKCSESRDKDCALLSRLYRRFSSLSWRPRELYTLHGTVAWLQKGGQLVLAAKWEYKLKHETEEDLEIVPPIFWAYTVPGVTCEKGR